MNRKPEYAIITGASLGLGAAFAEACAARGYKLLLAALPGPELEDLAASIRLRHGATVEVLGVDLGRKEDQEALIATALAGARPIDLLVNNVGLAINGLFDLIPFEAQRRAVEINIQSTMALTYGLIPRLSESWRPRILTVASLSAFYPMPLFAVYASTKAWLLNWSLALREEVAELGIKVTVLAPGGINTNPAIRAKNLSQGLGGRLSAKEPLQVAEEALRASEAGRSMVIPGRFNRILHIIGNFLPRALIAHSVHRRWKKSLASLGRGEESAWYDRAKKEAC